MPQRRDSAGAVCNSVMGMFYFCVRGEQAKENGWEGAQLFHLRKDVVFFVCVCMGNAGYVNIYHVEFHFGLDT